MSLKQSKLTDSEKKKVRTNLKEAALNAKMAHDEARAMMSVADSARAELVQAKKASTLKMKKRKIDSASKELSRAQRHGSSSADFLSEANRRAHVSGILIGDHIEGIPQIKHFTDPKEGIFKDQPVRYKRVGGMYKTRPEAKRAMESMGISYGIKSKGSGRTDKVRSGKYKGYHLIYVRDE